MSKELRALAILGGGPLNAKRARREPERLQAGPLAPSRDADAAQGSLQAFQEHMAEKNAAAQALQRSLWERALEGLEHLSFPAGDGYTGNIFYGNGLPEPERERALALAQQLYKPASDPAWAVRRAVGCGLGHAGHWLLCVC